MVMRSIYWYSLLILVSGLFIHAGNGSISKEVRADDDKKEAIVKYKKRECFCCIHYNDQEKNPCWSLCGKQRWLHDICKSASVDCMKNWAFSGYLWQRNNSGLLPLSMAIFRGKKEIERGNSRTMVDYITKQVGKNVFNMVMLRDHAGCSAWMHAIYLGDVENIKTILLAVQQQSDDKEAVWKLLTTQYSGAWGYCTLTPLMVAVRKKNIPVIELLKEAAGKRFNEYITIQGNTGKITCGGEKKAIDFAGDDAEIIKLLAVEELDEYEAEEYIAFDIV